MIKKKVMTIKEKVSTMTIVNGQGNMKLKKKGLKRNKY
jgi:hypothetical protein